MADKRENTLHIKINDEADAMLELMAESMGDDKNKLAAVLLQRTLLGEGYALKVAAMRYARLNLTGIRGDLER